jgi:deoxyribodipyrimidine photo-lyase
MPNEKPRILLYVLRRDVRLSDNPIFAAASRQVTRQQDSASQLNSDTRTRDDSLTSEHRGTSFTHLLPVYVFPAQQIEVSGFLSSPSEKSPYPEARSNVAKLWRTGPHRTRFVAEGAWDLKQRLEGLECGSGLQLRVGTVQDVVKNVLEYYSKCGDSRGEIAGVWMTAEESVEEKAEEQTIREITQQHGVDFKLWSDEKYYIDECVTSIPGPFTFTTNNYTLAVIFLSMTSPIFRTFTLRSANLSSHFESSLATRCRRLPNFHHYLPTLLLNNRRLVYHRTSTT